MKYQIINVEDDELGGTSEWYYHSDADHFWSIIRNDWVDHCREKYFKYVKSFDVMITAGAHIGMYTKFYAEKFKTVYAFEPDPTSFFCLVNNVKNENVIKMQAALSNERMLVSLKDTGSHGHLTLGIDKNQTTSGIIPTLLIDDLNLQVCNLIQLDVEYYEYNALLGALETIKRCSPVIIAENGHVDQIVNLLEPLGYKIVDRTSYDTIWSKE
jgi:FkbM family methyltransferase